MATEIEAKFKVESLDAIEKKLSELKAEFVEEQHQVDFYFDDADGSLVSSDKGLRLRHHEAGANCSNVVTYKGPRQENQFKKREEINVNVGDVDSAVNLLSALGYKKALAFEKKRKVWNYCECEVGLDRLPILGEFVEIEGHDEYRISKVVHDLGLEGMEHIQDGYAMMMRNELKRQGKEGRQVYFSDTERNE